MKQETKQHNTKSCTVSERQGCPKEKWRHRNDMIKFGIVWNISAADLIRHYHNFKMSERCSFHLPFILKRSVSVTVIVLLWTDECLKKKLQQRHFFTSVQFPHAMANDIDFHNKGHYSNHVGSTKAISYVQNPPTFVESSSINFLKQKNNLSPASPMASFVN